jgi:hypothetical protein
MEDIVSPFLPEARLGHVTLFHPDLKRLLKEHPLHKIPIRRALAMLAGL